MNKTPTATVVPRVLVVAPFTHQNGHFVTFPRDLCCGLATAGCEVTLLHTRPFRTNLDWFDLPIEKICLHDQLETSPWWWKEAWARLANRPSNLCLAWIVWQLKSTQYDVVIWTDFQAQANVWALALARRIGLFRFRLAFVEHHPPDEFGGVERLLPAAINSHRLRLNGLTMLVMSKALQSQWRVLLGQGAEVRYVPWGLWPRPLPGSRRASARKALGIPAEARVLLVFGVQAIQRKHLDTLMAAVSGFIPQKPLWLLFVGASLGKEPHLFANWKGPGVETRIENSFVSEEQVETYFSAADASWANYRNFPGASGALFQAMGFGRLSLCSGEGEIGALCRELNLGPIVASSTPQAIRDGLTRFIEMTETDQAKWEHDVAEVSRQYSWPEIGRQVMEEMGFPLPLRIEFSPAEQHSTEG